MVQNAPVLYVAPAPRHALLHAWKRLWVGLMLRRGLKRAKAAETAAQTDGAVLQGE